MKIVHHLKTCIAISIILLIPALGWCGEIFGSVMVGDNAVRGAEGEVSCGGKSSGRFRTDNFGSYRLFVQERGPCTLTFYYQGIALPLEITSYEKPMRYDLEVRGNTIRRR
jgi:hypothetical protein